MIEKIFTSTLLTGLMEDIERWLNTENNHYLVKLVTITPSNRFEYTGIVYYERPYKINPIALTSISMSVRLYNVLKKILRKHPGVEHTLQGIWYISIKENGLDKYKGFGDKLKKELLPIMLKYHSQLKTTKKVS